MSQFFFKSEINWFSGLFLSKMSFASRIEINTYFGRKLIRKRRAIESLNFVAIKFIDFFLLKKLLY